MSEAGYAHFRDVHFPCPGRTVSVGSNCIRPPSDSAILAAVEAKNPIRIWESGGGKPGPPNAGRGAQTLCLSRRGSEPPLGNQWFVLLTTHKDGPEYGHHRYGWSLRPRRTRRATEPDTDGVLQRHNVSSPF